MNCFARPRYSWRRPIHGLPLNKQRRRGSNVLIRGGVLWLCLLTIAGEALRFPKPGKGNRQRVKRRKSLVWVNLLGALEELSLGLGALRIRQAALYGAYRLAGLVIVKPHAFCA